MHAAFAFCALVMVGSGTPDFMEPISPAPDAAPVQLPTAPAADMQAGRLRYEADETQAGRLHYKADDPPRQLSCPPAPGDPASGAGPAPATDPAMPESNQAATYQHAGARPVQAMNQGGTRPPRMPMAPTDPGAFHREDLPLPPTMNYGSASPGSAAGPRQDLAAMPQNSHHLPSQKAFDHYRPAPATSPYALLGASTNNGTVNTYAAYVRPAQEQQRANQQLERAANNSDSASDQPAPTYPPVFLNSGPYYPNYGAAR